MKHVLLLSLAVVLLQACQMSRSGNGKNVQSAGSSASTTSAIDAAAAGTVQASAQSSAAFVKPSDAELRTLLTPLQYDVTQHEGTEPPFRNAYWNNHEEGIYVDVVSGEPLFSSRDKYDSETGWPSFTKPLVAGNIVLTTDYKLIVPRTEVRSRLADSHLGHVFEDGPEPLGLRYCMNSAALRFVAKDRLAAEGYGEFAEEFIAE